MSEKRPDIQGIRGWAIILVLLFHFYPEYFPNGYLGVDMFFVISGFLVAMILRRNDELDVRSIRMFYYRRVKRIFPPYYLVIICSLTALFLLFPLSYRSTNLDSSRGAITLTSNIKTVMDDTQKYEKMLEKAEDLFVHMWSLCLEMQWYLLAPILFLIQRCAGAFEKTFFAGELLKFR
ncbi:acyltransferase [Ancylostoma ceylanicum]|uniref:Acyltransferase n=1 Tax=Ancylostoma ceylanicum TaxID=53326 RepID=A0A0D6M6V5_9BILA|nr:acyltransferase [Ancylostoma ceylanicum]